MAKWTYKKGENLGFQGGLEKGEPISLKQYMGQVAYGISEPTLLKMSASMMDKYENETDPIKKEKLRIQLAKSEDTSANGNSVLPHGIVLSRKAAQNLVDFIYSIDGQTGAYIAGGPCVCQKAYKKLPEGVDDYEIKDLTLYYGADVSLTQNWGHTRLSKEKAKEILADMASKGYVHNVLYILGKASGAFVLCNCDGEVCAVTRATRLLGPGINCEKGPEVVKFDPNKCLGPEKCGNCVKSCVFGVNKVVDGKISYDADKCMGCEVCVEKCEGGARVLEEWKEYPMDHIISRDLALAGKYGYAPLAVED